MVDKLTVADDVFQIAHKAQFEEDHRVDALLAAIPIITFRKTVKEPEFQNFFQTPVEIVLGYTLAQLEMGKQFFLVLLFSLHT